MWCILVYYNMQNVRLVSQNMKLIDQISLVGFLRNVSAAVEV